MTSRDWLGELSEALGPEAAARPRENHDPRASGPTADDPAPLLPGDSDLAVRLAALELVIHKTLGRIEQRLLDVAAELEDLRCLVDVRTQDVEPLLGKIAEERALLAKRLGQVRVALADLAAARTDD